MNRIRASLTHLAISAVVVGVSLAVIFFAWYPAPYFQVSGALNVVAILVLAMLIGAPLMTLSVFRPGKPGLVFDLVVITVVQLGALAGGLALIYQERPYYVVFAIDRFEVLARRDVDESAIEDERLKQKSWSEPIYAVASLPDSSDEQQQLIEDVLNGKPDIERRPEFWSAYAENSAVVLGKATPLAEFVRDRPDAAELTQQIIDAHDDGHRLAGLPVIGKQGAYLIVIEPEDKKPVGLIAVDPWTPPEAQATEESTG